MVSLKTARQLALSYEGAEEQPHFEKPSFRVKKKIFLTLDEKNQIACIKLDEIAQDIFCKIDKTMIYPVPNKWGLQGWTFITLKLIKKELFQDALTSSYCNVAPKSLAEKWNKG
ncbi:MAG: MmcQ/YjbR family DNA-binding protein [Saprospiraceae bacterium]|nr:MmcQ/YjbR family DNA-binding protein [Saprospiraceae bacterium]